MNRSHAVLIAPVLLAAGGLRAAARGHVADDGGAFVGGAAQRVPRLTPSTTVRECTATRTTSSSTCRSVVVTVGAPAGSSVSARTRGAGRTGPTGRTRPHSSTLRRPAFTSARTALPCKRRCFEP